MSKYIYAGLGSLILALAITCYVFANKYTKAKAELAKVELALQVQNKVIEQERIDLEKYKETIPKLEKQIEFRYRNITTKDSTCEAKLKSYKKVIETFYTRGAK